MAFIRAARVIGLSLWKIRSALDDLPEARTPGRNDWEQLSGSWRLMLDDRIAELERLWDNLNG